jgi:hypothetical protein
MLAQLRVAVTDAPVEGSFLEEPWRQLVAAARPDACADVDVAAMSTTSLFGGVGKPESLSIRFALRRVDF